MIISSGPTPYDNVVSSMTLRTYLTFRTLVRPRHDLPRYPYDDGIGRNFLHNDGIGSNSRVIAHSDWAENLRSRTDDDTITDRWMTLAGPVPSTTKCDLMIEGYVTSDHGRLTDDDSRRMIDKETFSDRGSRMNVHLRPSIGQGRDHSRCHLVTL
jgi:hypothetical protein